MAKTKAQVTAFAKKITKMSDYPLKKEFLEKFEEMAVHTRQRKPKELLLKRRPNEPKDVFDYRVANYEPITYGSMNKAFDNLNRILNGVNYKLVITDDSVKAFLTTKKFMRCTFDMFFQKIYLKRMIEDPNGFLVWLPGGEGVQDNTKKVMPYPVLLFSFNLIDWEDDMITFLSNENTLIKVGETYTKTGKVYYIITDTAFYRYSEQTGGEYILTEEYVHNIGELPIIPLGGDLTALGIYESFFAPYVAFGNEAIRQFSDWQALSITAAHPIREEFYMQCEVQEKKIKKGKKANDDENTTYSRKVEVIPISRSPYAVIQRPIPNADQSMGENVLAADIPSVRFISQGVEYVKNAAESYKSLLEQAEDSLHLNLGQMNQSGVAKEIDLQSHEDMLAKVANQLLDAKQSSLRFILAYINNTTYELSPVKLTKPASFRVKTEAELMDQLSKLKSSNAPAMLVCAVSRELALLRFSGDEVNQKIFDVITTYDPLFIYSASEKGAMVLQGTIHKDLATASNIFYSLLLKIVGVISEPSFLEAKIEDLYKKFLEELRPFLIPETILTDPNGNPNA